MRKHFLLVPIIVLALLLQACPQKTPVKPSQAAHAARLFAGAPLILKAVKDSAQVLSSDGTLSAAQVGSINTSADKVKAAFDNIAGDVEQGKFDEVGWDNALATIETELTSVLAVFGKVLDPRVKEIVLLAQVLIPSARNLIKQLQPKTLPTPALDAAGKHYRKNAITPTQILTLAIIATSLGGQLLLLRGENDVAQLWAAFHANSEAYGK